MSARTTDSPDAEDGDDGRGDKEDCDDDEKGGIVIYTREIKYFRKPLCSS